MLNSYSLLGTLQSFLQQRKVSVDRLTAEPAVQLMIDWFRFEPVKLIEGSATGDALVYRYGGWSEGCATGYKFSVLRRITQRDADGRETEWFAGITLLFEPSRLADLAAFETVSTDWKSIEAFATAIESSAGYQVLAAAQPMGAMLESGGLR
jgi:hypothetical protein